MLSLSRSLRPPYELQRRRGPGLVSVTRVPDPQHTASLAQKQCGLEKYLSLLRCHIGQVRSSGANNLTPRTRESRGITLREGNPHAEGLES